MVDNDATEGSDSVPTPKTIAHYRILSALGPTGMGQVYIAEDPKAGNRRVAIKTLPISAYLSPDRREALRLRLREEANALGRLKHRAIPTLYHVIESESAFYLVMEYIEGDTLADLAEVGGRFRPNE